MPDILRAGTETGPYDVGWAGRGGRSCADSQPGPCRPRFAPGLDFDLLPGLFGCA